MHQPEPEPEPEPEPAPEPEPEPEQQQRQRQLEAALLLLRGSLETDLASGRQAAVRVLPPSHPSHAHA